MSRPVAQVALAAMLVAALAGGDAAAQARGGAGGAGGAARGPRPGADAPLEVATVADVQVGDTRLADAAMARDLPAVQALLKKKVDVNAPGADGTPPLYWAVRAQDVPMAEALIRAGADVKRTNRYQTPVLALAAENGDAAMILLLLSGGADAAAADRTGETMLMVAARSGSGEAVKALLERGVDVNAKEPSFGQTALMIAVREDHADVVDLLIKAKADLDARTRVGPPQAFRPPGAGGGSHGEGIVRGGIPDQGARPAVPGGMSALFYAARDGRMDAAKALLDAGASIDLADANGDTPLLTALVNNQLPVAKLLLDRGASVKAVDFYGRTPLFAAVEVRNLEVNATHDNGVDRAAALELVKAILDKGADPNARTKEYFPDRRFVTPLGSLAWVDFTGQTPFLRAALTGDVAAMKLLLQYKADPKIATFKGTTPLMAAAGVNWVKGQTWDEGPEKLLEAVKLCVELGADVNAENSMGLRAVHGAANRGSDDIIQFLVSKGAKLDAKDAQGRTPLKWAEGVFLASNAPEPKPTTIALIKKLTGG